MRKGYLTPPVIIILALIVLAVAATLLFNSRLAKNIKNEPSPSPTTSPAAGLSSETSVQEDETANWKTYTGTNYQLRYPANWSYIDCSSAQYGGPCFLSEDYVSADGDPVNYISTSDQIFAPMKGTLLTIIKYEAVEGESLSCSSASSEEYIYCKEVTVDGIPAIKILSKSNNQVPGGEQIFELLAYVEVNKIPYTLILTYPECERQVNPDGSNSSVCNNKDEVSHLFDQILSTFKFLD